MVVSLVLGSLLLLGMAAAAGYAVRSLPAGSRVPLNAGVPEYSLWLPARAGLGAWLGAGAAVFAVLAWLTTSSVSAHWSSPALRAVLLPAVMLVMLAAEAGAVISARQRAGLRRTPAPPAPEPEP
ncbi:MAG: hypothetical protein FWE35_06950 [Streptosporangiales bacterium]|nr:hypothetical protein [Streptosporangiales bacterium]